MEDVEDLFVDGEAWVVAAVAVKEDDDEVLKEVNDVEREMVLLAVVEDAADVAVWVSVFVMIE